MGAALLCQIFLSPPFLLAEEREKKSQKQCLCEPLTAKTSLKKFPWNRNYSAHRQERQQRSDGR